MNLKRLIIAFVVCFVISQGLGFLIHGIWLNPDYERLADIFRPKEFMESMGWVFMLTAAITIALFCYIFTRGYQNRGVGEGVRYGALMGMFISVANVFDSHIIFPVPLDLAVKWFASNMVVWVILGVVLSLIYKPVE